MNVPVPIHRRVPALALLALLPVLGGLVPMLDCMAGDGRVAVESKHIPGTHGFPHNHLICIQHQASGWVPAAPDPSPPRSEAVQDRYAPGPEMPSFAPAPSLQRSRAPPAA
ncbi:MAG TPA: hypothetical protein VLH75_10410 [Longimicrobiales bacterium]|nr:hypothetical protein [Longimicrobiales bacterium]